MMQIRHLAASLTGAAFIALAHAASAQEGIPPVTPGGWAIVTADGKLHSNSNVNAVRHDGPGHYRVAFNQTVHKCAVTATIGGSSHTIVPGYIVVRQHDNVVVVNTFAAATLLPADFTFDLNVACPA